MTIIYSIHDRLLSQGFSVPDAAAIFAIMDAVPYCADWRKYKDYREEDFSAESLQRMREMVEAVARAYRTHFLDARINEGKK